MFAVNHGNTLKVEQTVQAQGVYDVGYWVTAMRVILLFFVLLVLVFLLAILAPGVSDDDDFDPVLRPIDFFLIPLPYLLYGVSMCVLSFLGVKLRTKGQLGCLIASVAMLILHDAVLVGLLFWWTIYAGVTALLLVITTSSFHVVGAVWLARERAIDGQPPPLPSSMATMGEEEGGPRWNEGCVVHHNERDYEVEHRAPTPLFSERGQTLLKVASWLAIGGNAAFLVALEVVLVLTDQHPNGWWIPYAFVIILLVISQFCRSAEAMVVALCLWGLGAFFVVGALYGAMYFQVYWYYQLFSLAAVCAAVALYSLTWIVLLSESAMWRYEKLMRGCECPASRLPVSESPSVL